MARGWCAGLDQLVGRGARVVVIPMTTGWDVPCLRDAVARAVRADVVLVSRVGTTAPSAPRRPSRPTTPA